MNRIERWFAIAMIGLAFVGAGCSKAREAEKKSEHGEHSEHNDHDGEDHSGHDH